MIHRRVLRPLLPGALSSLVLAGCGDAAAGSADLFTVRDSAGIRIAESAGPSWEEGRGWRLSEAPAVEIGMADGPPEYLLSRVANARRLADGTIIVANSGTNEIRLYGADGAHVRSFGRSGSGPGEFRGLSWAQPNAGNTILAFDSGTRRLSEFTVTGEFIRTFALEEHAGSRFPEPLAPFGDGSVLVRLGRSYGPDEIPIGDVRPEIAFARYTREGAFFDSVGTFRGDESYIIEAEGITTFQPPLLGRTTRAAVSGNGLYVGMSDTFDIGWYGPQGRLERFVRRSSPLRPATSDEVERLREERLAGLPKGPFRRFEERVVRELPARETHPAFASFQADDAGNLWVEESRFPWEPALWTVFDPEGRMLGSITLPEFFRPTHFGADFVLGIARDELEVERVQLYDVVKS